MHWGRIEIWSVRPHSEVLWGSCGRILLAVLVRMGPPIEGLELIHLNSFVCSCLRTVKNSIALVLCKHKKKFVFAYKTEIKIKLHVVTRTWHVESNCTAKWEWWIDWPGWHIWYWLIVDVLVFRHVCQNVTRMYRTYLRLFRKTVNGRIHQRICVIWL